MVYDSTDSAVVFHSLLTIASLDVYCLWIRSLIKISRTVMLEKKALSDTMSKQN